jgi:hypothetical protein
MNFCAKCMLFQSHIVSDQGMPTSTRECKVMPSLRKLKTDQGMARAGLLVNSIQPYKITLQIRWGESMKLAPGIPC